MTPFESLRRLSADSDDAYRTAARLRDTAGPSASATAVWLATDWQPLAEIVALTLAPVVGIPIVVGPIGQLPAFAGPNAIVGIINTSDGAVAETEALIQEAVDSGAVTWLVASDPANVSAASRARIAHIDLGHWPTTHDSATQIAYFAVLGCLVATLGDAGASLAPSASAALDIVARQTYAYAPEVEVGSNPTRMLADALDAQSVVFVAGTPLARAGAAYAASRLASIAGLNATHREIPPDDVGWRTDAWGAGVLLVDGHAPDYLVDRIDLARGHFQGPLHELTMDGASAMARFWSTMTLLDWTAFYLAR